MLVVEDPDQFPCRIINPQGVGPRIGTVSGMDGDGLPSPTKHIEGNVESIGSGSGGDGGRAGRGERRSNGGRVSGS